MAEYRLKITKVSPSGHQIRVESTLGDGRYVWGRIFYYRLRAEAQGFGLVGSSKSPQEDKVPLLIGPGVWEVARDYSAGWVEYWAEGMRKLTLEAIARPSQPSEFDVIYDGVVIASDVPGWTWSLPIIEKGDGKSALVGLGIMGALIAAMVVSVRRVK